MWYLKSDIDNRVVYVVPNKEITIGRSIDTQTCNFAIPDDPSISRKHATLSVSDNNLYLEDMGSRYGTFINDFTSKIEIGSKIKLNLNDVVKFGKMNSVWKVYEISFVTCTSTMKGENLQNLKLRLSELGGILKNEWDDTCCYLTMPAITLTIKVVLALAQGSHIVTTEYWNKCVEAVNNHMALPDTNKFIPQVVESTLNKENVSFLPNNERQSLFAGKTIVFFSRRQLEMYKTVLMKCSASPLLLSETKMTKSALCEPNVIVIQYNLTSTSQETQAQRNQINDIVNHLKSKGKRVVADAEIGLAILYCSLEKYCNPAFNFSSEVIKQTSGPNTKSSNVLAQESQEPTQKLDKENVVINESLPSTNSKRKMSDDNEFECNANKKIATEIVSTPNESVKRKFNDDSNGTVNPSKKIAANNEDDGIFNFLDPSEKDKQVNAQKKLNFSKPHKRKQDLSANDEEDLFNFVEEKKKCSSNESSKNAIFDIHTKTDTENDGESPKVPKVNTQDEKIDISAMRGTKLKELMENTDFHSNVRVKKEDPDEIDRKMNDLDLGTTVITVRKNLIIKKETIEIKEESRETNFKKFKKVWPIKMQVTIIPKSSMSIVIPDTTETDFNSMAY